MKRSKFPMDEDPATLNGFSILSNVDWTEPWLIGLISFHTFVTLTTVLTRHNGGIQGVLFLFLLFLVYSSETLNEVAAQNWRSFSRQQYFDSSGMFISIIFSAPLLMNCIVMIGQWMWSSGILMIQLKKKQLRHQLQQQSSRTSSLSESSSSSSPRRQHRHSKTE